MWKLKIIKVEKENNDIKIKRWYDQSESFNDEDSMSSFSPEKSFEDKMSKYLK